MATLETRLQELATRAGTQSKALRTLINGNAADLSALATTDKTSIVNALNEVYAAIATAAGIDDGAVSTSSTWSSSKTSAEIATARAGAVDDAIDDTATSSTTTTLSAAAILAAIAQAKSDIIGGAGSLYDTLGEIQALLQGNDGALAALNEAIANRVRFDAAQSLTGTQQTQARTNIGAVAASAIGNPDRDLVADFNAALV